MPNYHITRDDVKKYKGNPNGAIMPDYVGQLCIDELKEVFYISTSLNINGWISSIFDGEIDISNKQDTSDSNLSTTDKTITGAINELKAEIDQIDISNKQDITDNSLNTTDKTISGAINELKTKVDETFQEVDSGKTLIAAAIDNPSITKYSTFIAMSKAIANLKNQTGPALDAADILYNMMIEDGYNEANSEMTTDELIGLLDRSSIEIGDIKQIACGSQHTFIVKNDGSLWACGDNVSGELGLGDNTDRKTFTQVTKNISNDVKQVYCGDYHTFIIKNDGSLWSCGTNGDGQLGSGSTISRNTFAQVTKNVNNDVKQIACGEFHTFILKNDGSVWACGSGTYGQLGLNTTSNKTTFAQVTTNINNDVKQIACGNSHTFILKNDGSLWSCGFNEYGQLGLNDYTNKTTFTQVTTNINQVYCGGYHTFILKNDGSLWSCGYNSVGQLGLDSTTKRNTFKQVTTNINNDVKQIACGYGHTIILKNDGSLWACGGNGDGQLGLNSTTSKTTFTQVTTNITNDVKQVYCGDYHTFILKNDGSVWSCGKNSTGQLGIGTTTTTGKKTFNNTNFSTGLSESDIDKLALYNYLLSNEVPVTENMDIDAMLELLVILYGGSGDGSARDAADILYEMMVEDGYSNATSDMDTNELIELLDASQIDYSGISEIICGEKFGFILKKDGTVYACGDNNCGQLGLGNQDTKTTFTQVNIDNVKQVSCGYSHTVMLKNDGTIWVSGDNLFGQLGLGSSDDTKTTFTQVNIDNVKQVSCGCYHTVILKNDGTIWACGYNDSGQLGLGNQDAKTTFTQVNIDNVKQVSCGYNHTVILKNDGTIWVSGDNNFGELGLGSSGDDKSIFTQVLNIDNIKQIDCGAYHTAILKNDGTVWFCGYNRYGQLGFGANYANVEVFTQVTDINNVKQIDCGYHHTVVLKNDGSVLVSGRNNYGQLGLGDTSDKKNIFTQVNINDAKQISCGYYYTFILKNDGSLYACGDNDCGELGLGNQDTPVYAFTQVTDTSWVSTLSSSEINRMKLYIYLFDNEISVTENMDIDTMLNLLVISYGGSGDDSTGGGSGSTGSSSGGIDIVCATSLPETSVENQIVIITSNVPLVKEMKDYSDSTPASNEEIVIGISTTKDDNSMIPYSTMINNTVLTLYLAIAKGKFNDKLEVYDGYIGRDDGWLQFSVGRTILYSNGYDAINFTNTSNWSLSSNMYISSTSPALVLKMNSYNGGWQDEYAYFRDAIDLTNVRQVRIVGSYTDNDGNTSAGVGFVKSSSFGITYPEWEKQINLTSSVKEVFIDVSSLNGKYYFGTVNRSGSSARNALKITEFELIY